MLLSINQCKSEIQLSLWVLTLNYTYFSADISCIIPSKILPILYGIILLLTQEVPSRWNVLSVVDYIDMANNKHISWGHIPK